MKRLPFVLIASVILIAVFFAACNGGDSGKITDTTENSPILSTVENMMTEAASDMSNAFSDNQSGSVSDTSGTASTSTTTM